MHMALLLIQSPSLATKTLQPTLLGTPLIAHHFMVAPTRARRNFRLSYVVSSSSMNNVVVDSKIIRRSGNYKPSIWDHETLQSIKSDYTLDVYAKRVEKLKEEVRHKLNEANGLWTSLKLIDTIQRLGLNYHFHEEIKSALDTFVLDTKDDHEVVFEENDLYNVGLRFRLLRQHGYEVSQDVFKSFKDELKSSLGDSKQAWSVKDIEGMLSLYEASFYAFEGEEILDEAQELSTRHLKQIILMSQNKTSHILPVLISKQVSHALELPLHWTVARVEARWFIDTYSNMQDMDPLLLELAKLDFNMVQATYQEDLKYLSRWWTELGLTKLSFARDRLAECFLWSIGFNFEPKFGNCRREATKVGSLITTIDDIYDVYGSPSELNLFTEAVERWDINMLKDLPDYMKICFLALFNTTNAIAYQILRKHGLDALPYLKKAWGDLCKAYLVEANWYNNGYTPTFEEYMNNAWISCSGQTLLMHAYFLLGDDEITNETAKCLKKDYPDIIRLSSMILRFTGDLGTSKNEMERGDVQKSIQCYMHHASVSESTARDHIRYVIGNTWKKMNQEQSTSACHSILPKSFIDTVLNAARMGQCMYQFGDGHGCPDGETKDRIMSIVVEPIPLV